jgi:carbon-monoxide dehydrogenase medium subunit
VDLGQLSDLSYIRPEKGGLLLGAMTTYFMVENSNLVQATVLFLSKAASLIADIQVRNRGTVGGSLAHADPAADLPAVMVALEAQIRVQAASGKRTIPAAEFFADSFTTVLKPDEVLTEIFLPVLDPRTGGAYLKFANKASHYAIVGVAAVITLDAEGTCVRASIGITGAGHRVVRATAAEGLLVGQHITDEILAAVPEAAAHGIEFLEDIHASPEYRRHLTGVYVAKAVRAATKDIGLL